MIPETIVLGQVLAPIVSALIVIVLYHYIGRDYLGAEENKYWNAFRVSLLSAGDSTVRQKTDFALTNAAPNGESQNIGWSATVIASDWRGAHLEPEEVTIEAIP